MKPMQLPWSGKHVPHGTIDIMGTCNIACRRCYNRRSGIAKPVGQVKKDLSDMLLLRRLHTVTLTGGEATMHPDLMEIISYISSLGIKTAIVSNGLLLDSRMLKQLKKAGLDLMIVHIQADQERPDLSPIPTEEEAAMLRDEKLQMIAEHGIETGVSYIIYKDRLDEFGRLVRHILSAEYANFALFTIHDDFDKFIDLQGSVTTGLRADIPIQDNGSSLVEESSQFDELSKMLSKLGLDPFAHILSSNGHQARRWHTYLAGTVINNSGKVVYRGLRSSILERLAIRLSLLATGSTPFFYKAGRSRFQAQLLLNGLLGGAFMKNWTLLKESMRNGSVLQDKHFILQRAPELLPSGEVVFCRDCPDSTIRNGVLVPACLADRMMEK